MADQTSKMVICCRSLAYNCKVWPSCLRDVTANILKFQTAGHD